VFLEIAEILFHEFDHPLLEFEVLYLLLADGFLVVAEDGDLAIGFVVDLYFLFHGFVL
jgi:hypothetical protein